MTSFVIFFWGSKDFPEKNRYEGNNLIDRNNYRGSRKSGFR
jgi:hypothetical protein